MPLHHVKNLRIALLRLHHFGAGRFRPHTAVGHTPVSSSGRTVRVQLPKVAVRSAAWRPACPRPCDTFEPKAWPYDTALPSGLPEVNEGPGRPDNVRLLLRRSPIQNPTPPPADQEGQSLDVIA